MSFERHVAALSLPPINGVPQTLGEYSLLTKLASGGMATVYVARKTGIAGFERLVAIKCCHPHLRDDEEFVSMFLDEARLAASIRHPNVVATLDVSDGEFLYIVMEYIEGSSLGNLVRAASKAETALPPAISVRVMIDTLLGLHAAHELRGADGNLLGLVHRDVSPQNILIGVDGVSRITDFGIAFAASRSTVTQEGRIKGKFSYLSPEQAKSRVVTRRSDVFSAGTVLWEALTGRPLFRRGDEAATIGAVLSGVIPPPSAVRRDLPRCLDAVVMKALQRNPDTRYRSAAEFAEALEELPLDAVSARGVGSHVEETFAAGLFERRELIRQAAESSSEPRASHSRPRNVLGASTIGVPQSSPSHIRAEDVSEVLDPTTTLASPANDEIEHRRLRGILAAAMLLLVGSALGLLLARAPADTSAGPSEQNTRQDHTK